MAQAAHSRCGIILFHSKYAQNGSWAVNFGHPIANIEQLGGFYRDGWNY
ncbi:unnamed protein product [marine sediment metagenome]|uniref:Uncharacterized protein n=1 Tax=marine sediment metagenome TaxID=412755 RepID=X0V3E9_9ZZZZ